MTLRQIIHGSCHVDFLEEEEEGLSRVTQPPQTNINYLCLKWLVLSGY